MKITSFKELIVFLKTDLKDQKETWRRCKKGEEFVACIEIEAVIDYIECLLGEVEDVVK